MTNRTKESLKYFLAQDTFASGHHMDWERFYKFVAIAFVEKDTDISFEEFNSFFKEKGGQYEKLAHKFFSVYERCMDYSPILETQWSN